MTAVHSPSVGFTKEFLHSGLGYSKRRGVLVVDNNAVSIANIPAASARD